MQRCQLPAICQARVQEEKRPGFTAAGQQQQQATGTVTVTLLSTRTLAAAVVVLAGEVALQRSWQAVVLHWMKGLLSTMVQLLLVVQQVLLAAAATTMQSLAGFMVVA